MRCASECVASLLAWLTACNGTVVTIVYSEAFPLLVRQHRWFLRTQGGAKQNAFYWRHTTTDHCLASGLDDFPRGQVVRL